MDGTRSKSYITVALPTSFVYSTTTLSAGCADDGSVVVLPFLLRACFSG